MHDELAFDAEALREWQTLSAGIREQFKKKLAERLIEPRIPASKLRESSHRDNINRRTAGFAWSTRCVIARCWCWLWRWNARAQC